MLFINGKFRPFVKDIFTYGLRHRVHRPTINYHAVPILCVNQGISSHSKRGLCHQFALFLVPTIPNRASGRLSTTFHNFVSIPIITTTELRDRIKGVRLLAQGQYRMAITNRVLNVHHIKFTSKRGRFTLRYDFYVLSNHLFHPCLFHRARYHPYLQPAHMGASVHSGFNSFNTNSAIILHQLRVVYRQIIYSALASRQNGHRRTTITGARFINTTPCLTRGSIIIRFYRFQNRPTWLVTPYYLCCLFLYRGVGYWGNRC